MELTHGSLFSGIGGFDLGFQRCGIETLWQVELDGYCRQVLERHFPQAGRYADIRECGAHNLEPVDILSGGFPCQDISHAGRRVGIDGDRSGLWSEFARIIGELRPRYVCVENVAALLGRGMGRVLGDLAGLGYDAEWDCLRAFDVGAPHLRARVWIVAYPQCQRHRSKIDGDQVVGQDTARSAGGPSGPSTDVAYPRRERPPRGGDRSRTAQVREVGNDEPADCGETLAQSAGEGWRAARPNRSADENGTGALGVLARSDGRPAEPQFRGVADGLPTRLDADRDFWTREWQGVARTSKGVPHRVARLKGLGNALVPQIAEYLGRLILLDSERKP